MFWFFVRGNPTHFASLEQIQARINARPTQGPTDRAYQEFVSKLEEEDLETGLEGVVEVGIFRFRSKTMSPTWVLLQVIDPFYQSLDLKSFKNKPSSGDCAGSHRLILTESQE
jgi:hypothetical protein